MAAAIFSDVNEVDGAATVLTASSEAGDLTISNVANPIIGRVHRTTVLTAFGQADFVTDKTIDVAALIFARTAGLPLAGTVQHTFDADGGTPGAGAAHDSGAIAIGTADGYGYHVYKPSASVTARYWRWTFAITGVNFIDTGRAWAGAVFQPGVDINFNDPDDWGDLSVISQSVRSGAEFIDTRPRQRRMGFGLSALSDSDRISVRDIKRRIGNSKQILVVKDPASFAKETILGRATVTAPLLHRGTSVLYATTFLIRESL